MDEFKLFLREKRDEIDIDIPPAAAWENIRNATANKTGYWIKTIAAASLLIFIVAIALLTNKLKNSNTNPTAQIQTKAISLDTNYSTNNKNFSSQSVQSNIPSLTIKSSSSVHNIKPIKKENNKVVKQEENIDLQASVLQGFGEMQKSFAIIINHQINTLKHTPVYSAGEGNTFTVFKKGLEDLNIDEENTKLEVYRSGLHDVQIEKLINIYQQKIVLLKKLQSEIEKVNLHSFKDSASYSEKLKPNYINL